MSMPKSRNNYSCICESFVRGVEIVNNINRENIIFRLEINKKIEVIW